MSKPRRYTSDTTRGLTEENWQAKVQAIQKAHPKDDEPLLDLLGDVRAVQKLFKKVEGYLKEIINLGEGDFTTDYWDVTLSKRYREGGLDMDRVREEMGSNWITSYTKDGTEYDELRLKRRKE